MSKPSENDVHISGADVQTLKIESVKFWMEPLIPMGNSIILIHGKFGTAKTPILSNIAKAIASGQEEVLNCAIRPGRVLFVQADTPKAVIVPRLQAMKVDIPALDFNFCYPGFNILEPHKDELDSFYYSILSKYHRENKYDIVFIDSLRAIHSADDKESTTVHQVYRALSKLFYGATIVLIHHDKKFNKDNSSDETFSGSQAWVNHATVTLKFSNNNKKENEIKIEHTKTQASETIEPIIVKLAQDGINIIGDSGSDKGAVGDFIQKLASGAEFTPSEIDLRVSEFFGFSKRTAQRRRIDLGL